MKKIIEEAFPCLCKPGQDYYCHKHGLMGRSPEQIKALDDTLFGMKIKVDKNLKDNEFKLE